MSRHVYLYLAAVMAFSTPFWFVGFVTAWQPLPGLPVSSLMVVVPGVVAFIAIARAGGRHSAISWLKRACALPDLKRGRWLVIAALLPPVVLTATLLAMQFSGSELPDPSVSFSGTISLLALFIIPAAFEELGWSCFALVALQQRMSALRASVLIGVVWAIWHIIPPLQAGRAIDWIAWWCLATVALRVLTTWIFNNTSRTLIPVALFHASENMSWQSFPVGGSHYEPGIHAVLLWVVCMTIIGWFGGKTLSKNS